MRDFQHGYAHLYRHALRGAHPNPWPDLLLVVLWCVAYGVMCLDLWLLGLGA